MTHTVTISDSGVQFEAEDNETIMEAALRAGYRLRGICENGGCGACKAFLVKGEIRRVPSHRLRQSDIDIGVFLTCRAYCLTDITVEMYCRRPLVVGRV